MLGKDIGSWTASAGSDRPNKLANCEDGIRCQVMQLHVELAQNISKHRVAYEALQQKSPKKQ
jgi:hypothetical protein